MDHLLAVREGLEDIVYRFVFHNGSVAGVGELFAESLVLIGGRVLELHTEVSVIRVVAGIGFRLSESGDVGEPAAVFADLLVVLRDRECIVLVIVGDGY